VAIDWAFLGWAALGQEVGQLVVGSVLFYAAEPAQLRELDALAFEAYLAGLREAGWDGDPRAVRFGCAADQALRHGLFSFGLREASEAFRARLRHATGHAYEEDMERFLELRRFMLARAAEARALLPHL
jgi:hypothetical protein